MGLFELIPSELILQVIESFGISDLISLALTCSRFRALIIASGVLAGAWDKHRLLILKKDPDPLDLYKSALKANLISRRLSSSEDITPLRYSVYRRSPPSPYNRIYLPCGSILVIVDNVGFTMLDMDRPHLEAKLDMETLPSVADEIYPVQIVALPERQGILIAYARASWPGITETITLYVTEYSVASDDFGFRRRHLLTREFYERVGQEPICSLPYYELYIHMCDPYVLVFPIHEGLFPSLLYNWRSGDLARFVMRFDEGYQEHQRTIIISPYSIDKHPFRDALVLTYQLHGSWIGFPEPGDFISEIDIRSQISWDATSPATKPVDLVLKPITRLSPDKIGFDCHYGLFTSAAQVTGHSTWVLQRTIQPVEPFDDESMEGDDDVCPGVRSLYFSESEDRLDTRVSITMGPRPYVCQMNEKVGRSPSSIITPFQAENVFIPASHILFLNYDQNQGVSNTPQWTKLTYDLSEILKQKGLSWEVFGRSDYQSSYVFDPLTGKLTIANEDCLISIQY
ncbi:hypothetical protein SISNIDRAFT_490876 [Sistotremastrum niveocremeum HHB9708]|uniref:F-box domain-containing protein n=1 Tax=Sistotremastrum niveocremeum HHB9708 TaxID=1314777 RepID=A0A164NEU1_9AGAM|nr:hypothetical protein SISNIDRAFT_490876 [Sistotremastrum niveocremeum HHB9708]